MNLLVFFNLGTDDALNFFDFSITLLLFGMGKGLVIYSDLLSIVFQPFK